MEEKEDREAARGRACEARERAGCLGRGEVGGTRADRPFSVVLAKRQRGKEAAFIGIWRVRRRSIAGGRTKISRRTATKRTRRCRRSARSPRCRIPWSLRAVESRGPAASSACSPPCWTRWG